MPTYEYKCLNCGNETTKLNKVDERFNAPQCDCGQNMNFVISTPMVNKASAKRFECYKCPVTDKVVTSERQKKSIESEHGLIIKEKGIFPPRKEKFVDETPEELKKDLEDYTKKINNL
jgi:putative FmdB family regulatory protein